jgi:hypothetical protein
MAQFSKLFVFNFVKILQEKINYITNFFYLEFLGNTVVGSNVLIVLVCLSRD